MRRMTVEDILRAADGRLLCGGNADIDAVTTDSRAARAGTLFIPLVGDKFDAHDFIKAAFDLGAEVSLTHKDIEPMLGKTLIRVNDTRKALGDIAAYYMEKHKIPTLAVTGSVGKTTTKDMLYSVMSQKYNTLKTPGNKNNDIGLPLTILSIEEEHEAAVLEMGMNHFGEIDYLASIAKPDAAVITNIGMSHIENLGSREGIFKAKLEIANRFTKDNLLIVNGDDEFLSSLKGRAEYRVMYYGIKNPENDVYAKDIEDKGLFGTEFTAVTGGGEYRVRVTAPGVHNVYNALAAICAGEEFGISAEECVKGIEECEYTAMRMEIENVNGITVINDCYNASPDSIKSALEVLCSARCRRRIAVLGDVLEMGDFSREEHYKIGSLIARMGIDALVTAGENAAYIAEGARDGGMKDVHSFEKTLAAARYTETALREGDGVLIKASRGMHFEDIVNAITN